MFNIYLEEALASEGIFQDLIRRKDLLAYADDIAIFTNSDLEVKHIVEGFRRLERSFNLRINLNKCEMIRINEGNSNIKFIEGIQIKDEVKYLGLKIVTSKK